MTREDEVSGEQPPLKPRSSRPGLSVLGPRNLQKKGRQAAVYLYGAGSAEARSLYGRGRQHRLTILAIALAFLIFSRPQVYHILRTGWPWNVHDDWLRAALFGVFVIFLGLFTLVAAFLVVPLDSDSSRASAKETTGKILQFIDRIYEKIPGSRLWERITDALMAIAERLSEGRQILLGSLLVACAVGLVFLPLAQQERTGWQGALSQRLAYGLLLVGYALWYLIPATESAKRGFAVVRRALGRYLFLVTIAFLAGELLWRLPDWLPSLASFRYYTIWALAFLLFLLVGTARIIDAVPQRSIKWLSVVAFILYLGIYPGPTLDPGVVPEGHSAHGDAGIWFNRMQARIAAMPPGPVIFVAASGGGSRAALFTGLVLEALSHEALDTPSGEGEGGKHTLDQNIALISAVSGGGLASAYYLNHALDGHRTVVVPRGFLHDEVGDLTHQMAVEYYARYREKYDREVAEASTESLQDRDLRLAAFERTAEETKNLPSQASPRAPWLFTSAFVDDMATDFMAPLLRGVFLPWLERGNSVAGFWAERFGLDSVRQRSDPGAGAR